MECSKLLWKCLKTLNKEDSNFLQLPQDIYSACATLPFSAITKRLSGTLAMLGMLYLFHLTRLMNSTGYIAQVALSLSCCLDLVSKRQWKRSIRRQEKRQARCISCCPVVWQWLLLVPIETDLSLLSLCPTAALFLCFFQAQGWWRLTAAARLGILVIYLKSPRPLLVTPSTSSLGLHMLCYLLLPPGLPCSLSQCAMVWGTIHNLL